MWVEKLIKEYSIGKNELEKYRQTIDKDDPYQEHDYELVSGMISDMQYALEWMRRGRRPGNRRGIERRSVYQRTALLDPELFPSLNIEPKEKRLTDDEKRRLIDILWTLSDRERQCFLLHMTQGMSYAEIAKELKISRSSVQKFVERARGKIQDYKQNAS